MSEPYGFAEQCATVCFRLRLCSHFFSPCPPAQKRLESGLCSRRMRRSAALRQLAQEIRGFNSQCSFFFSATVFRINLEASRAKKSLDSVDRTKWNDRFRWARCIECFTCSFQYVFMSSFLCSLSWLVSLLLFFSRRPVAEKMQKTFCDSMYFRNYFRAIVKLFSKCNVGT